MITKGRDGKIRSKDTVAPGSEDPWTEDNFDLSDTLDVIRLGHGTVLGIDRSSKVPSLAASFRASLADAGVSKTDLLDRLETTKEHMAKERCRALTDDPGEPT